MNRAGEGLGFTGAIVAQMTCGRGGGNGALNGDPGGGRVGRGLRLTASRFAEHPVGSGLASPRLVSRQC